MGNPDGPQDLEEEVMAKQLTEAETAVLRTLQQLPPTVVFALGAASHWELHSLNVEVVQLLKTEGFIDEESYALTPFAKGIADTALSIIKALYPEPEPLWLCVTEGCGNARDPMQDLCIECQDKAAEWCETDGCNNKKEPGEDLCDVCLDREALATGAKPIPATGNFNSSVPQPASNGDVAELHVEEHADGRVTTKEVTFKELTEKHGMPPFEEEDPSTLAAESAAADIFGEEGED